MSSTGRTTNHNVDEVSAIVVMLVYRLSEGGLHAACKRQMRRDRTDSPVNKEMPSPRSVPKSMLTSPHAPLPPRGQGQSSGQRRAQACCWYAAVCHEHRALLEPIEEDKHSDLSPLTREMPPRHLYGESFAAFGLSWCKVCSEPWITSTSRHHVMYLLACELYSWPNILRFTFYSAAW